MIEVEELDIQDQQQELEALEEEVQVVGASGLVVEDKSVVVVAVVLEKKEVWVVQGQLTQRQGKH